MAILPLADCSRLLGIHPKTLHHWLKQANIPLAAHPTDARINCLTEEHVQQLASQHGRPLQLPASSALSAGACAPDSSGEQAPVSPENKADPFLPASSLSAFFPQEADLIQKLSSLETKVLTLQEQLAQLALALLQERDRNVERRITALETVMQEFGGRLVCPPPLPHPETTLPGNEPAVASKPARPLHPAEQRARSRLPPLIEYSAQGTYVTISSQEGELHLVPASAQWFDWLATLSSFRFVGKLGRFTAYRESSQARPSRSWSAHRCIHKHHYRLWLGVTDRLTIASVEETAAKLQAYVDAL